MDRKTEWKWDLAAERPDSLYACGPEKRWEPIKEKLFARMGSGRILFVAVGTGLDIAVSTRPPNRRPGHQLSDASEGRGPRRGLRGNYRASAWYLAAIGPLSNWVGREDLDFMQRLDYLLLGLVDLVVPVRSKYSCGFPIFDVVDPGKV